MPLVPSAEPDEGGREAAEVPPAPIEPDEREAAEVGSVRQWGAINKYDDYVSSEDVLASFWLRCNAFESARDAALAAGADKAGAHAAGTAAERAANPHRNAFLSARDAARAAGVGEAGAHAAGTAAAAATLRDFR